MRKQGRLIAHYNEKRRLWQIRIIDARGRFSMPAALIRDYQTYRSARQAIEGIETKDEKQNQQKA